MLLPKTPFSKSNHFGISINDTSVRGVVVDANATIINSSEVLFNEPIIIGDQIDSANLIAGLRQVVSELNADNVYAAVCIPEKHAYSRTHSLPNVASSEIDEAVNWQIEKIFPFSRNEIYLDWKLIDQTEKESKILVTVIQKTFLDELKNICHASGIFPISFEPSASALTRLSANTESVVIIVELTHHSTSATLIINGISSITSTATFSPDSNPQDVLNQISTSIQSLINHATQHHIETNAIRVVLTGEKASPELATVFTNHLGVATSLLDFENIESKFHLSYAVASAQIFPPTSEKSINLLPTSLQKYYQAQITHSLTKAITTNVVIISALTICIAAAGFFSAQFMISQTTNKKTTLEQPIEEPAGSFNLAIINKKASRIVQLFPLKQSPQDIISTILSHADQDNLITSIQINKPKKQYSITGISNTRESLLSLKQELEATGLFSKINIPLSTLEIQKDINFTLNFTVKQP